MENRDPYVPFNHFRFYELDLMRFLAALSVLFYHYTFFTTRIYSTPEFGIDKLLRYGYLGVDAFFMISGYVVLMSSMNKSPKYFFVSRVTRLYPAFWTACLLTFAILYFGKITQPGVPAANFKLLAYNLTMLQGFFGKPDLNGVFWTLTYEIGFYFIILLIAALKFWKNLLPIILLWLGYTFIAGPHTASNAFYFLLMPKYSCCFIAGMLCYLLRIKYASSWKIYLLLTVCYLLNIKHDIVIMEDMNNYYHDANAYRSYIMIIIVTILYLFFLLSALQKLDFSKLKQVAQLGVLTYPLYLIHGFGIGAFMILGNHINKHILLAAVTIVMILFSFIIYKYIEKKVQPLLKSLITKLIDFSS
ncbi:acyltransferase family protein [Pedobacter hiemivivus]|uniref:Acyltransferase n=1 Tax=Pedobacter hiemivivus TaxID=2530454 RepID=A0A4R0MIH0_9SPHI|nr:acyltransferase [Pedobacter hiemivivus]TCC86350.1 acyltransferase [Pedobacter hiemivivus]